MIRINPRGGFIVAGHPGLKSEALVQADADGFGPRVVVSFPGPEDRAQREADQQAVLTWLLDKLGCGLTLEFNQSMLAAEGGAAGCAPAVLVGPTVAEHVVPALVLADAKDARTANALEATIADIPVVERAPGAAAPRKPRASRGRAAVAEGLAQGGEQQPQDQKNIETLVPASAIPVPPAKTASPFGTGPSEFTSDMAAITAQQQAERSPAEPQFRPADEGTRVVPDLTPLDKLVHLLTTPPMPADLHPIDLKRRPGDTRMADTALVRLYYQRHLEPEYAANAANPNFYPDEPAEGDMLVDTSTDGGVVALTQMILRIRDRATELGQEIPQVEAFALLGDESDIIRMAVERVRQRRDRHALQQ